MSQLTPRENVLRVYRGEMPEWVPVAETDMAMAVPLFLIIGGPDGPPEKGMIFNNPLGTPHIISDPFTGPMPLPGDPQVKDINHWRDYMEFPFMSPAALDWSPDIEVAKTLDRENKAISAIFGGAAFAGSPFNAMVDVLGHEAALAAMLTPEDKDAWHELIGYLTDWELEIVDKLAEIYEPDIMCIADDLACAHGPFMSLPAYREMIKPYQKRIVDRILEHGCYAEVHCCGFADAFVDDWVELGVKAWNPAQVMNDLVGIKQKYGRDFVINGGYNSQSKINAAGASESEVRASIRESFAKYAPGGGYIFSTSGMALVHELGEEHMGWIMDEAAKCSQEAYK